MRSYSYKLSLLSKLMGMATIGILMCHAHPNGVNHQFHLNSGQMGVRVFFLVSGLGLYYSIRRLEYSVSGIVAWYSKRIVRLLLPYLVLWKICL